MARKTITTVVDSDKNDDGEWVEYHRTVTTVVEVDDDGYPYGPVQIPTWKPSKPGAYRYNGPYGYGYFGSGSWIVPAVKREDGKDA